MDIKPCPFCGSNEKVLVRPSGDKCRVICYSCDAEGSYKKSEKEAIEAWNKAHDKQPSGNPGQLEFETAQKWVGLERDKMRFELVKAAMPAVYDTYKGQFVAARDAIELADAVLKKLEE